MKSYTLRQITELRERVDNGQVQCMAPRCTKLAVQVASLQYATVGKCCTAIIACPEHAVTEEWMRETLAELGGTELGGTPH